MNDASWEFGPEAITAADWRQIVQSATDTAIITTNQAGSVTSWNQGASQLLGWTEEEMLGRTLARLFEDSRQINRESQDARDHGLGGDTEGWRIKKGGSRPCAVGEMAPIRDAASEITGLVKILRDRTRAKAAEEAAAEKHRALEILNRAGFSARGGVDTLSRMAEEYEAKATELLGHQRFAIGDDDGKVIHQSPAGMGVDGPDTVADPRFQCGWA